MFHFSCNFKSLSRLLTDFNLCSILRQRHLLGKAAAVISDILPAKEIVDEMVQTAVKSIQSGSGLVVENSRARL